LSGDVRIFLLLFSSFSFTCRVQSVNIQGEIYWLSSSNSIQDPLYNSINADSINLSRLNDLKATVTIIIVVTGPTQFGANSSMNVGVVGQETFLGSVIEVRAVVNRRNFTWGATKNLRLPHIKMRVKINDRNWDGSTIDRSQKWKCDGVVTPQGDQTRQSLAVLARSFLLCVSGWRSA
jgi:hypothetical protein